MGILNELIRTKSVIGAQLGLFWKDSLWEQLDAKGKYDNTISAIKTFFLAQSLLCPVVIALEDGQWLDSDSFIVLQALTRHVRQYPFLIFSTIRYSEYGSKPYLLNPQNLTARNIPYREIELREFSEADLRNFAEAHLGSPISEEFYAVLAEKTNGNPFFAEQLLHYFIENELVERTVGRWQLKTGDPNLPADTINVAVMYSESLKEPYYKKSTQMPDAINAMLMARIDRLSDEVKEVVKAASVIGREFDVRLLSAMLKRDVHVEVNLAEKSRIWLMVQELLYIFKHALLRDIAYEMQLKARLRELHQLAAETMEKLYEPHLARWYADLAFHYEQAENRDKAVEYLQKAGDEAKSRYQNQQALHLYDRLLSHLQEMFGFTEVEIDTLLKKAEILDLIGEWKACQQVCEDALELAKQMDDTLRMGQVNRMLGIIFRRTGKYDKAIAYFEQALELFETIKERARIGQVFSGMGVVYWQRGDLDTAMMCYENALKIVEELENKLEIAKTADNMGILYDILGDYDVAMKCYQKSLQIFEDLGEKLEMSHVVTNIGENRRLQGDYDAAMAYYERALELKEKFGDKLHIAIVVGNIGHIYKAKGNSDTAIVSYDRAIAILRELENKYYLSEYSIGKADALFSLQRSEEARALNAEGLQIAEETGMKEYIFQGKVLSAKIDFVLGNEDAPHHLEEMLQQTKDDAEIAALHYELWKMTYTEDHRQKALNLYRMLYKTTPNIQYKTRMEELQT